MRSPGHRAAILSRQVTHMGIGVMLQRSEDSGTAFLVTQIFSEPFAPAAPDELAAQIAEAIRARRSSLYLSTPMHSEISAFASSLALSAISDPQVFSTRKESIASTLREVDPSYNAWRGFVGTAFNADDVALPELLDDREIKSIGIGAAGSAGSPMEQPVTFVVLVAY